MTLSAKKKKVNKAMFYQLPSNHKTYVVYCWILGIKTVFPQVFM